MPLKDQILLTAVKLAKRDGLRRFIKADIARIVGCGTGSVNYHFRSMEQLRSAIIKHAIEYEVIEILVQARAERHPCLRGRLTPALKERIANQI